MLTKLTADVNIKHKTATMMEIRKLSEERMLLTDLHYLKIFNVAFCLKN